MIPDNAIARLYPLMSAVILAATPSGGLTRPPNYQTMIKGKLLAPRTAINDMIKLIDGLTLEDSGVFYAWTGRVIPW